MKQTYYIVTKPYVVFDPLNPMKITGNASCFTIPKNIIGFAKMVTEEKILLQTKRGAHWIPKDHLQEYNYDSSKDSNNAFNLGIT
jgi:hypothetical protein